jgi:hypothetical protein
VNRSPSIENQTSVSRLFDDCGVSRSGSGEVRECRWARSSSSRWTPSQAAASAELMRHGWSRPLPRVGSSAKLSWTRPGDDARMRCSGLRRGSLTILPSRSGFDGGDDHQSNSYRPLRRSAMERRIAVNPALQFQEERKIFHMNRRQIVRRPESGRRAAARPASILLVENELRFQGAIRVLTSPPARGPGHSGLKMSEIGERLMSRSPHAIAREAAGDIHSRALIAGKFTSCISVRQIC